MRVTFLEHSGFLVELPSVSLLFDWWRGKLPELAEEKPLYVFASHSHPDHFLPAVFALDDGRRDVRFLLGNDIRLNARNLEKWGVSAETAERCQVLKGGQTCALPRANVETLSSTDEGVAFLVSADGQVIFHAGDLNWWHWEGEDKAWNNNMAANFKRYAEPLRGRKIDLAMFPLDARLHEAGFWGPEYFLKLAAVRRFLPMHQWNEFSFTAEFLAAHPEFAEQTVPVERNGQVFQFS
jgi:L-ascorbate metabolism protein UlaG (beta-lactamase superfamily)